MKHIILLVLIFLNTTAFSQWETGGGNSRRNGQSGIGNLITNLSYGNTQNALFGSQIYSQGGRIVLMRFQTIDYAPIVCISAGNSIEQWAIDFPGSNSRSLPIGFRDNQIYAINFRESGFDTIYALNPADGSVIWRSNGYYPIAGIVLSATFTSNGDLIMPESGGKVMRINKINGQKMWSTSVITPNTGSNQLAVHDSIVYGWTGSIVTPKRIYAMSAATGQIKYYSPDLPGDGDQESSITISPNGTIYCIRDGGNCYALVDNGSAITIKWSAPLPNTATSISPSMQIGIGRDSSVYVPYKQGLGRLNHITGNLIDSSIALVTSSTISPRITITLQNKLLVSNGGFSDGAIYCLEPNLDTIWSKPVPGINNSGPAGISHELVAVAGSGTMLRIIQLQFVGVQNNNSNISGYTLSQNYPNPFNPSTEINFSLPKNSNVVLDVYSSNGKLVKNLVNDFYSAGEHTITFYSERLTSGIYFYTMKTGDYSETKKMMFVK